MEKSAGLGACRARALPDLLGLLAAELGLASLLGLLGLLTLGYQLTLVIDINAYLFIAVAVTSLFSHYLLIVVLVIYSLLEMIDRLIIPNFQYSILSFDEYSYLA